MSSQRPGLVPSCSANLRASVRDGMFGTDLEGVPVLQRCSLRTENLCCAAEFEGRLRFCHRHGDAMRLGGCVGVVAVLLGRGRGSPRIHGRKIPHDVFFDTGRPNESAGARPLWVGADGATAHVLEMAPGSRWEGSDVHEPGPEEVFVVSGTFDDGVREYPVGSFIHAPAGSWHVPQTVTGCTLFVFYPEG